MNLNEGQRVYARNFHVSGPGVVVYIAPTRDREMLPVQVEMDEGDEDGHRMYRFKYDEVEAID
ncbi:hypothetical protein [Shouchella clausii]|uniref:hypothetical protein n=1 Tax=Shouchella clausii TaxID=79880 RepID=UPI00226CEA83|nr:hypothetical protein [Shouchella clausii]MCY1105834.1 hypothetical protein [Shouchella clausii]